MALKLEELFPDSFTDSTLAEIQETNSIWATQWLEGWEPNREDVELSLKVTRGEMTHEEYRALIITQAKRRAADLQPA